METLMEKYFRQKAKAEKELREAVWHSEQERARQQIAQLEAKIRAEQIARFGGLK